MARLFTTTFNYQQQSYTALVSLTECNGAKTMMIHLPDESLHQVLPGGTVCFDAEKGLPLDFPNFTAAQGLLLCVLTAIEKHEQAVNAPVSRNQ